MIIYKHIPKTAGLSLKTTLPENTLFLGHDYYNIYYKHLHYHIKNYPGAVVLSVVRNPFDRVVSAFHYLDGGGNNPIDEFDRMKYISRYNGDFEAFARGAFPEILQQIHFMPQWTWIYWGDTPLYDHIYKFEDITAKDMPVINKSQHVPYREYYTADLKNIIYKHYRKDFRLFEY